MKTKTMTKKRRLLNLEEGRQLLMVEPEIDVLVPPIVTTDEDGNTVTECPDGYTLVQTARWSDVPEVCNIDSPTCGGVNKSLHRLVWQRGTQRSRPET